MAAMLRSMSIWYPSSGSDLRGTTQHPLIHTHPEVDRRLYCKEHIICFIYSRMAVD